ncbi:MAG: cyclic nucleotide-binding domain-containing protein [Polyangiales bacterium]
MEVERLAQNPILARFDEVDRGRLAAWLDEVAFEPGAPIIREGDVARDLYVILEGVAGVERSGVNVGAVGPGAHVGELGLLTSQPRAAGVLALSAVRAARLSGERFDALCEEAPDLGIRFVRALVDGVSAQLQRMTDSVGSLLRERSLPRRVDLTVRVGGETRAVRTGTSVGELLPEVLDGQRVVAGLVSRRPVSLSAALVADCEVEPLTEDHWEGQRVLRASAALLLLEAANEVLPGASVRMGPSFGASQRVLLPGLVAPPGADLVEALRATMAELIARDVPIREEWWAVDEAAAHFAAAGWDDAAALLASIRDATVPLVSCGRLHALRTGPLLPSAGRVGAFSLDLDDGELTLRVGAAGPREPAVAVDGAFRDGVRDAMSREHERWLGSLGVSSVGAYNRACVDGAVATIIRVSEGFHEKRLGRIADEVAARPGLRIVCVAGPSSSGKTTFLKRLSVQLRVAGINPVGVSLDDYYVDRARTPRDARGEYDYEALEALDLPLLGDHLRRICRGEAVKTARYDFVTGLSAPAGGREISLGPKDILLLEGIHGLNPRLLEGTGAERLALRVFIQPMTSLAFDRLTRFNPSDLRLLRRIVRDRHGRDQDAAETIRRWPSVRAGERRHIFPHLECADVVFDTSLIYEPSVLKVYAERYLLEVPSSSPSYATAYRLRQLIDRFVAIYPEHVPPTSILREFVGGSGFEY